MIICNITETVNTIYSFLKSYVHHCYQQTETFIYDERKIIKKYCFIHVLQEIILATHLMLNYWVEILISHSPIHSKVNSLLEATIILIKVRIYLKKCQSTERRTWGLEKICINEDPLSLLNSCVHRKNSFHFL